MKLTPEQIAKIEAVLTEIEENEGHRSIVIKHDLPGLSIFSNFLSIMRTFGVDIPSTRSGGRMSARDKREFLKWLREKKKREETEEASRP